MIIIIYMKTLGNILSLITMMMLFIAMAQSIYLYEIETREVINNTHLHSLES